MPVIERIERKKVDGKVLERSETRDKDGANHEVKEWQELQSQQSASL